MMMIIMMIDDDDDNKCVGTLSKFAIPVLTTVEKATSNHPGY